MSNILHSAAGYPCSQELLQTVPATAWFCTSLQRKEKR